MGVNEEVLVFYGPLLFNAKIINIDPERPDPFRIHYTGWTKRHDAWVGLEMVNKNTLDNRNYQQELKEQMLAEKEEKKRQKQIALEEKRRKKSLGKKSVGKKSVGKKKAREAKISKRVAKISKQEEKISKQNEQKAKKNSVKRETKKQSKKKTKSPSPTKKQKTKKKMDTTKSPTPTSPIKTSTPSPTSFTPKYRVRPPIPWHWKSDFQYAKDDPRGWTQFTHDEIERIEEAFKKNHKSLKLDEHQIIDFQRVVVYSPHRLDDARTIKRGGITMRKNKRKYVQ